MKAVKSLDTGSVVMYGAVLAALWTLAFGVYYWLMGWLFGAQSWWIDMNLALWTEYTFNTLLTVIWRMIVNGVGGAIAGLVIALFYNASAAWMGGIKMDLE